MSSDRQLFFPFSSTSSYSLGDFFVSDCNVEAFECVMQWPSWPSLGMMIVGPHGSGKTHLAHLFQEKSKAQFYKSESDQSLTQDFFLTSKQPLIFDDVFPKDADFFHLLNMMKDENISFLILKEHPFQQDKISLNDLRSRLLSIPVLTLKQPDDALLKAIIQKRLSDAQITISESVMRYSITHMKRSYKDAQHFCDSLITHVQGQQHNVTVPLVRKILSP